MKILGTENFTKPAPENGTLVIFGEALAGGYCTGLINACKAQGFQVIYSTMGHREAGKLAPLSDSGLAEKPSPTINVPLEAGFDMTPNSEKQSLVDLLNAQRTKGWQDIELPDHQAEYEAAEADFAERTAKWAQELDTHLEKSKGPVLFAHIMAGGFPRSPTALRATARLFKGHGSRFQDSAKFWNSQIGKVFAKNFEAVAADTFKILVEETKPLKEKLSSQDRPVAYIAYGYHGNCIKQKEGYKWRGVASYSHGKAKVKLEEHAKNLGLKEATIFNCPEVITRSSKIFTTLDPCIFAFLLTLNYNTDKLPENIKQQFETLQSKVKNWSDFESTLLDFFANPKLSYLNQEDKWPQENSQEQVDLEFEFIHRLSSLIEDYENVKTNLSDILIEQSGKIILETAFNEQGPVCWIGHNSLADYITKKK